MNIEKHEKIEQSKYFLRECEKNHHLGFFSGLNNVHNCLLIVNELQEQRTQLERIADSLEKLVIKK